MTIPSYDIFAISSTVSQYNRLALCYTTYLILLKSELGPVFPQVLGVAGHHVGLRALQVGLAGHVGLPGDELGHGHGLGDLLAVPVEDGNMLITEVSVVDYFCDKKKLVIGYCDTLLYW